MRKQAKKIWTPLDLSKLPDCDVIACDPSLTALGLVWIHIEDSTVAIAGAERLSTVPTGDRVGWEDTFYRAELMEALIDALIDLWTEQEIPDNVLGVHEAPPSGGGAMMRTESSILTGYAFRQVMNSYNIEIDKTVTPQSHKKLLCGNHIAKKTEHHEAIKTLLPHILGNAVITNEAMRDALSIGLYAAHRLGAS